MKRMWYFARLVVGVCLLNLLSISTGAHAATLIGDDLTIRTLAGSNPNINDNPVTVLAGIIEYEHGSYGRHNIEAEYIYVDWMIDGLGGVGFDSTLTRFDYLDLDWTDQPGWLTGVSLTTNIAGLDDSRVLFGDDFVSVAVTGLSVSAATSFYRLDLQVSHVPIPPALLLFATGLIGLAGFTRRAVT